MQTRLRDLVFWLTPGRGREHRNLAFFTLRQGEEEKINVRKKGEELRTHDLIVIALLWPLIGDWIDLSTANVCQILHDQLYPSI